MTQHNTCRISPNLTPTTSQVWLAGMFLDNCRVGKSQLERVQFYTPRLQECTQKIHRPQNSVQHTYHSKCVILIGCLGFC
jgi:hypothetical protein